ncbi:MAG: glycosyltransferase [Azoarcus sp.]|jgi:glycosyltransferase involved in cell wall biosynthesis|nr:glycosyltransferase [Azoarcus sp.]
MNRHILFFLSDLDGGGAQRTLVNLVNTLHDLEDVSVTLVVTRTGGAAQAWLKPAVRLLDLGLRRTLYSFFPLCSLLKRECPDVVMATMVDANIMAALALFCLRSRIRLVVRETNSHRARGDIRGARCLLAGWAYRRADAVVALSSGVRQELIEDFHLGADKVVTIGNPVDIESIAGIARAARERPSPFPIDGDPIIMAAGRLTRQKGFDILLHAFARMKTRARLIILGEGADRSDLLTLAKALGVADRVSLPGFVSDIVSWLCHANLFVLSSRWEGFGHVIVEAMSAGVPVISTKCPHGPADIITDGLDGILVETNDVEMLATKMDFLLEDRKAREEIRRNLPAAIKEFEITKITKKYLDLFSFLYHE